MDLTIVSLNFMDQCPGNLGTLRMISKAGARSAMRNSEQ